VEPLFGNVYSGKTVFVTGHNGFKGSWLAMWLQELGANVVGFSLPDHDNTLHYKSLQLGEVSIDGDICDSQTVAEAVGAHQPDIIFHLAAQSLLRDSYRNPTSTYATNVMGTLNVFEAARKTDSVKAIVNVTTDKVYENEERDEPYTETDPLGGFDPYSSSKACAEILTSSYRNSFLRAAGISVATARAGNVVGGGDWANDRLVPDIMRSVKEEFIVKIRSPRSIRSWQHVLEPVSGYLLLGQKLLDGKEEYAAAWNFGPAETSFLDVEGITEKIKQNWEKARFDYSKGSQNEPHEARILKLDSSKSKEQLGWSPVWDIDKTICKTVVWYRSYLTASAVNSASDLEEFVSDARELKQPWCA
jgi:CDP-glucose 4,6-dehydratase